jgi:hypothetical protein
MRLIKKICRFFNRQKIKLIYTQWNIRRELLKKGNKVIAPLNPYHKEHPTKEKQEHITSKQTQHNIYKSRF